MNDLRWCLLTSLWLCPGLLKSASHSFIFSPLLKHVFLQNLCCFCSVTANGTRTWRVLISLDSFAKAVWPATLGISCVLGFCLRLYIFKITILLISDCWQKLHSKKEKRILLSLGHILMQTILAAIFKKKFL